MKSAKSPRQTLARCVIAALVVVPLSAMTWNQNAKYVDAETLWRATLDENPACWTAHNHLGFILQQRGLLADAATHYREALKIKPDSAEARVNLGQLQLDGFEGRLDEAAEQFQAAIQLEPRSAIAHGNLGLTLLRMGRLADAIPELKESTRLRPDFGDMRCSLGVALDDVGRTDEAVVELRECRRLEPAIAQRLATAHVAEGDNLLKRQHVAEAVKAYQQAARLVPDSPDVKTRLARLRR